MKQDVIDEKRYVWKFLTPETIKLLYYYIDEGKRGRNKLNPEINKAILVPCNDLAITVRKMQVTYFLLYLINYFDN